MRRGLALAGALGCALWLAASAGSTIVVGRGIAGVVLGSSQARVRAKLCMPVSVVHGKNEFGTYTEFRYRGYVVDFQADATVTSIVTTLAREKTPEGVGVGSGWSQVRAKVPHVGCEGTATLGDCHVGDFLPGKRVTDFVFRKGKVVRVVVGFVLD